MGLERFYDVPSNWNVETKDYPSIRISSPDNYVSVTFTTMKEKDPSVAILFNKTTGEDYAKKLDIVLYDYTFDTNDVKFDENTKVFSIGMKDIRNDGLVRRLFIAPNPVGITSFYVEIDPFTRPDVSEKYLNMVKHIADNIQ